MGKTFFKNEFRFSRRVSALWVLVGLVAVCAIYFYTSLHQLKESLISYANSQIMIRAYKEYEQDRLTFCYDNSVHPCTDEALWEWNDRHAGGPQFTVRSRQQVTDAASYINDF